MSFRRAMKGELVGGHLGWLSFHSSPLLARHKRESAKGKAKKSPPKKEVTRSSGPTAAQSHPCQVAAGNAVLKSDIAIKKG